MAENVFKIFNASICRCGVNPGPLIILALNLLLSNFLFTSAAEEITPQMFGAKGDGLTDDTASFQAAFNFLDVQGGGTLSLGNFTYILAGPSVYSNTHINGKGSASILKQKANASFVLRLNTDSGGTTNFGNNVTNVNLSDFTLRGRCDLDGFFQFNHLLGMSAVTGVQIDRVNFIGPQGDAIYIGSTLDGSGIRHNSDITITRCELDGLNNQNRNGISVIDGQRIKIRSSTFLNLSTNTMPGCIDLEPNVTNNIISDIEIIGNTFSNCLGNKGLIVANIPYSQEQLGLPFTALRISDNDLYAGTTTGIYLYQYPSVTRNLLNQIAVIKNRVRGGPYPFGIQGISGLVIADNQFQNTSSSAFIGNSAGTIYEVEVSHNSWSGIATERSAALYCSNISGLRIHDNEFSNCAISSGPSASAVLLDGITEKLSMANNVIKGGVSKSEFRTGKSFKPINPDQFVLFHDGSLHNDLEKHR
jgi:hypothetical protein